jgi:hypothetical protein
VPPVTFTCVCLAGRLSRFPTHGLASSRSLVASGHWGNWLTSILFQPTHLSQSPPMLCATLSGSGTLSLSSSHLRTLRANTFTTGTQTVTPRLPLLGIHHSFIDIPLTNPETPFDGFDFSYDFLPEMDFGDDFCFGGDFSFLPELDVDFFEESSLLGVDLLAYNAVSISHLVESIVLFGWPKKKRQKQKQRSPNRTSYRASVRTSCWYKNYLEPGQVRETTHKLARSDWYGELCHWFQMPLYKVERLTTNFVPRGCIREPRIHWRMQEFHNHAELLVMSALNILGHGASFRSLRCAI